MTDEILEAPHAEEPPSGATATSAAWHRPAMANLWRLDLMPTIGPYCAIAFESETDVDEAIGLALRWWTPIGDHGTGGRVSGNSQEAGSGDA